MPLVKLVLCHQFYGGDEESHSVLQEGIADWEELTDEELKFLRLNIYRLSFPYEMNPIIVVKDSVPARERIKSIKDFIQKEKDKIEAEKVAAEKKKRERLLKKQAKTKEQELKLLDDLKAKYEKN